MHSDSLVVEKYNFFPNLFMTTSENRTDDVMSK